MSGTLATAVEYERPASEESQAVLQMCRTMVGVNVTSGGGKLRTETPTEEPSFSKRDRASFGAQATYVLSVLDDDDVVLTRSVVE